MKIYTKRGDRGETSLLGGKRVGKDNLRIEAYGTVDELNSFIGYARSLRLPRGVDAVLDPIQHDLFVLGAGLASPLARRGTQGSAVKTADVTRLERAIDAAEEKLAPLKNFILPGGHPAGGMLHVARTVCRRAERLVVRLARDEQVDPLAVIYLNRLSDLLFVLARKVNHHHKKPEIRWSNR